MKKNLALLLAALIALSSPSEAFMRGGVGAAKATITQDGHALQTNFGSTLSVTLSTTKANDIIIVYGGFANQSPTGTPITDNATLTWNLVGNNSSTGQKVYVYWALAPAVLTNDTITLHITGAVGLSFGAVAFNGVNTTAPLDKYGLLPITNNSGTVTTLSTATSNTVLLSFYAQSSIGNPTAGTGFTAVPPGGTTNFFLLGQYQIVTTPQTNVSCGQGGTTTNTDADGAVATALVAANL